jgi:CHAT domain-containing protein
VVWDPDDDEASLTIDIAQSGDRELRFSLHVCSKLRDKADLPGRLSGTCQLKGDPSAFMSAIYAEVETRAPGDHLSLMEGVGTRIYRATPDAFKQAYAAIDAALEADELAKVTVQIATEDAHIPWELMFLPQGKRPGEWLGVRHPVARWPADRSGQLRPRLGGKHIAALVPSYAGRNALKFAQCEAELLAGPQFAALTVAPATKARARDLLAAKLSPEKPIGILHFAGHGRFDPAGDAAILLEDGKLLALDVDTSANTLGEHDRTVVFMNACQTGRTGALLEGIGGWAETWLARGYRGFIAPLWSVVDDSAYLVTKRFYELALGGGVPVAEALRQVRGEFAPQSHTYLSYVYFGDVTARF